MTEKTSMDAPCHLSASEADAWASGYNAAARSAPEAGKGVVKPLVWEKYPAEAMVEAARKWFDENFNGLPNTETLVRGILEAALSTEPGETEGWQPIETAPFDKPVDLWCIEGYEREATWPVRGFPVGGRHKSKDYGWFGNQSKDGVPQKDAPDLVPVAWRPVNVPTDLVAAFLRPAAIPEDAHHG